MSRFSSCAGEPLFWRKKGFPSPFPKFDVFSSVCFLCGAVPALSIRGGVSFFIAYTQPKSWRRKCSPSRPSWSARRWIIRKSCCVINRPVRSRTGAVPALSIRGGVSFFIAYTQPKSWRRKCSPSRPSWSARRWII